MAPFARTTAVARPVGRPTQYRHEYCEQVIAHMKQGRSLTSFAGSIEVSRNAVYEWIRTHREFGDAVARAQSCRVTWLEDKLLRSKKGAETTAAIFALRNAAPDEWRDMKYTEHKHSVQVSTLTDAQLNAIAAGVSPGDAGIIEGTAQHINER
jgi:transposase-like protein